MLANYWIYIALDSFSSARDSALNRSVDAVISAFSCSMLVALAIGAATAGCAISQAMATLAGRKKA